MLETRAACQDVDENMSDIIEGVASSELFEHVANCERCRDARYDAEQLIESLAEAGSDYRVPDNLEARLMGALDASADAKEEAKAEVPATSNAPVPTAAVVVVASEVAAPAEVPPRPLPRESLSKLGAQSTQLARRGDLPKRGLWLSLAAVAGLGVLWLSAGRDAADSVDASALMGGAWQGEVLQVERAFGSPSGLQSCKPSGDECRPIAAGARIEQGTRVQTDGLTRALMKFSDGTLMALDRATQLSLDGSAGRRGRLLRGNLVAEVEKRPNLAVIDVPLGRAEVIGTKFALSASEDSARVEVSRGEVKLLDRRDRSVSVHAGEAGLIRPEREPRVETVLDLARAFSWQSAAFDPKIASVPHGAVGQLTAKRPADKDELSNAVRLVEHHVKVRIVDNIARTEVEEVFSNQTGDVLEGIYRFPLPPGAQIERLALDVDGKLVEGAFVERERAAAIWRGAIVNSGGKKPPPVEEIIWVPGPWKDPALLEWQRGNRFELRIFPIPRRGSRRIVIAYTELLGPSAGGRQYVYPLPRDPAGSTHIDRFTLEAQVRGHDTALGVTASGYPLKTLSGSPDSARLAFEAENFQPVGDLSLSYQLENADAALRAWAYQAAGDIEAPATAPRPSSLRDYSGTLRDYSGTLGDQFGGTLSGGAGFGSVPRDAAYVAMVLRPSLPRRTQHEPRDYVFIADSSRSMIGESYRRASALIERTIREMDRNDRFTVLACDSICERFPGGLQLPGPEGANATLRFLESIQPEGASDLGFAVEEAGKLGTRGPEGRALRVVYVGDGTPTVGPIHPALIRRAVAEALPRGATLSAVAVGGDADRAALEVATDAGGGVSLALAPGHDVEDVSYALLGATYGHTLEGARLELPEGLVAVAPHDLGSVAAGEEKLVVARMTGSRVEGKVVLRGRVAGEDFEQTFPLEVAATTAQGNAFVPRLYAAVAIGDLERYMDEGARRLSIELSTRFNVASRYTSLLVLESPAMFKAFGLDNQRSAPEWSGEQASNKSETWGEGDAEANAMTASAMTQSSQGEGARLSAPETKAEYGGLGLSGRGSGGGGREAAKRSRSLDSSMDALSGELDGDHSPVSRRAAPKPTRPSPPPSPAPSGPSLNPLNPWDRESQAPAKDKKWDGDDESIEEFAREPEWREQPLEMPPPRQQRMIPMRRVWDRVGRIDAPPRLLQGASPQLRESLASRFREHELSRKALKDLYAAHFLAGELDRAADLAAAWSEKDPLDPDALTARADLAAERGHRDEAIRILGSVVDVRPGDHKAQWRLARLHRWAGAPARGCRHALAVAQLMLRDAKLVHEAVRCSRDIGQGSWASDLLDAVTPDVREQVLKLDAAPRPSEELSGDFRVRADWDGAEHDLDLVIIHPEGYRISWLGAPTQSVITAANVVNVRVEDLALRGAAPGEYAVEVVRSSPTSGSVRGTVELTVAGQTRTIPFVLDDERVRVATAEVRMQSRLVPIDDWMGNSLP